MADLPATTKFAIVTKFLVGVRDASHVLVNSIPQSFSRIFCMETAFIDPALARALAGHVRRNSQPDQVRYTLELAFATHRPAMVEVLVEAHFPLLGSRL